MTGHTLCRHCAQLIHRATLDDDAPWVHAQRATDRCNDGRNVAEPEDAEATALRLIAEQLDN